MNNDNAVMADRKLKILIADDHWLVRSAIARLLGRLSPFAQTLETATVKDTIAAVEENDDLDLVLLDLNMPDGDALEAISDIRERRTNVPIVMISVCEDRADVLQCLDKGAVGYIPKTAAEDEIMSTVKRVLNGEVALPQRLLLSSEPSREQAFSDDRQLAQTFAACEDFTPRQKEIFMMLAEGAKNQAIADQLNVSVNTVRVHIQAISSKLPGRGRTQLEALAARWKARRAS